MFVVSAWCANGYTYIYIYIYIYIYMHIIINIIAYVYIKFLFWRISMFHILADMFDGFFFLKHFCGSCFLNFMFSPDFVCR
jgi:hypothetical protein